MYLTRSLQLEHIPLIFPFINILHFFTPHFGLSFGSSWPNSSWFWITSKWFTDVEAPFLFWVFAYGVDVNLFPSFLCMCHYYPWFVVVFGPFLLGVLEHSLEKWSYSRHKQHLAKWWYSWHKKHLNYICSESRVWRSIHSPVAILIIEGSPFSRSFLNQHPRIFWCM